MLREERRRRRRRRNGRMKDPAGLISLLDKKNIYPVETFDWVLFLSGFFFFLSVNI